MGVMPDDIQFNGRDLFWVAMVGERIALADWIQPYPWVKNFIAKCVGTAISKQLVNSARHIVGGLRPIQLRERVVRVGSIPLGAFLFLVT